MQLKVNTRKHKNCERQRNEKGEFYLLYFEKLTKFNYGDIDKKYTHDYFLFFFIIFNNIYVCVAYYTNISALLAIHHTRYNIWPIY